MTIPSMTRFCLRTYTRMGPALTMVGRSPRRDGACMCITRTNSANILGHSQAKCKRITERSLQRLRRPCISPGIRRTTIAECLRTATTQNWALAMIRMHGHGDRRLECMVGWIAGIATDGGPPRATVCGMPISGSEFASGLSCLRALDRVRWKSYT